MVKNKDIPKPRDYRNHSNLILNLSKHSKNLIKPSITLKTLKPFKTHKPLTLKTIKYPQKH